MGIYGIACLDPFTSRRRDKRDKKESLLCLPTHDRSQPNATKRPSEEAVSHSKRSVQVLLVRYENRRKDRHICKESQGSEAWKAIWVRTRVSTTPVGCVLSHKC